MAWTTPATFALNSLPTASNMNTYVRDNLRNLYCIEAAQTVTRREVPVFATAFRDDSAAPEIRGSYTADGVVFQFLGENHDNPSAITTGHKTRILMQVGERDGGTSEKLARIETIRTGAGAGALSFDTYYLDGNGVQQAHTYPAIYIDSANSVNVNKTGGAYALNVGGSLRAAAYKQGGASIGKWTLAGDVMSYAGTAEITGTWSIGAEGGVALEVDSTTVCSNVNAAKLRGKTWRAAVLQGASSAGVTLPAGYGYVSLQTVKTLTTVDAGWHLLTARLQVPISTDGHLFGAFGIMLPGLATGDDPYPCESGGTVVGDTIQVVAVSRYRATAGETLTMQAYNTSENAAVAVGYFSACWLSPELDVFPASMAVAIAYGTPTLTVV